MKITKTLYVVKYLEPNMHGMVCYWSTKPDPENKDVVCIGEGTFEADINDDTRGLEAEALKAELEQKQAAFQLWRQSQLERIQSLLCLENSSE